jgi:hypothetical protein
MMSEIVVGMYDSQREAAAARARLLAQGFRGQQVAIEEGQGAGEPASPPGDHVARRTGDEPATSARGMSGVIARMFSGALIDERNVESYIEGLRNGRCLLVVRAETPAQAQAAAVALVAAGPRTYSLPNAPSAWNEATAGDPPSIGGVDRDPARPGGLLEDAEGLSAQSDVTRLSNSPRVRRNR